MNVNATLFGQMITFAVLVWAINRFLWGPLTGLMQDRTRRIADGLAAAERGKHAQELAEKRARELLHEAKQQVAEIIAQAQKRAGEIIEEAKIDARKESGRTLIAARAEIDQMINRAREQLRGQVANVAVAGARRILQHEMDAKVHGELLADLVAQI